MESQKKQNSAVSFLSDVLRGAAIGVAFIIPGFSGGTVAAILGIYEKLVGAIADLFKHFLRSIKTLLPIALGMLLGVAALILPIQWGLERFPLPTVSLFVGLALGGLPSIFQKCRGGKAKAGHIVALVLSLAAAASLLFLPHASKPEDFLLHLNFGGYLLLLLVGIVGSCALVVPGISGSMLLLIFGYYNPIVRLVTENLVHGLNVGRSLLALSVLALGVVIGFFLISILMKYLLKKFPRGTFFSILGFIIGSVPAVYASVIRDTGTLLFENPWYWVASAAFLLLGAALAWGLQCFLKRKTPKRPAEAGKGDEN